MNKTIANYKVQMPKFPKDMVITKNYNSDIEDEEQICEVLITDCIIDNQCSEKVEFKQVRFRNVIFKDVIFKRADFEDVIFENCDLSNIDLSDSILSKVEFINCKMVGINFSESSFIDISIKGCNGNYGNLRYSQWKRAHLEESQFRCSDFQNMKLKDINLVKVNFDESQMSGAILKGIDMSDCQIHGIGIRAEDLEGLIVSPLQAVDLSKFLGLVIKD